MKEYWVNVYEYCNDIIYGQVFNNVKEAFEAGQNIKSVKYMYCLHIKMDGGYNKRPMTENWLKYHYNKIGTNLRIKLPEGYIVYDKPKVFDPRNKFNWMD